MVDTSEATTQPTWIRLSDAPLDVGAVDTYLRDDRCGGVVLFLGTTRRWTDERETAELAYDCYRPMALQTMQTLADEARSRWPVLRVAIHHRLGVVPAAEASVVIGVASPHRASAYEASRFLIDMLKERVPIWKKEHYTDGTTEWVEGTLPLPS